MRDAGVKHHRYDGRSMHALRHTMATDMLEATDDIITKVSRGRTALTEAKSATHH